MRKPFSSFTDDSQGKDWLISMLTDPGYWILVIVVSLVMMIGIGLFQNYKDARNKEKYIEFIKNFEEPKVDPRYEKLEDTETVTVKEPIVAVPDEVKVDYNILPKKKYKIIKVHEHDDIYVWYAVDVETGKKVDGTGTQLGAHVAEERLKREINKIRNPIPKEVTVKELEY